MWQIHLIKLYCTVCQYYDTILHVEVQRLTNNSRPQFSDQEMITVYLWGTMQGWRDVKTIYTNTSKYLRDWFPSLPSYQAFNRRYGDLCMAFARLAECLIDNRGSDGYDLSSLIIDSLPIWLARLSRSNHAKVACEICAKAYNASRDEWYYGLKLHAVVQDRHKTLPSLLVAMVSAANTHDLPNAKQVMALFGIWEGTLFGDKAYVDARWAQTLHDANHLQLATPHRRTRGEVDPFPGGNAAETSISSIRQKIEVFFNWLNAKTGIQCASSVRSLKGLLSHVFGKLAAALASLAFPF